MPLRLVGKFLTKWCTLSNGLYDFKAALIAYTSHSKNDMHSDHSFPVSRVAGISI